MVRIGTNGGRFIHPSTIIRIFRLMKTNPLKVWSNFELGINPHIKLNHMFLLKRLGLVESVPYYYERNLHGKIRRSSSSIMGWRLK